MSMIRGAAAFAPAMLLLVSACDRQAADSERRGDAGMTQVPLPPLEPEAATDNAASPADAPPAADNSTGSGATAAPAEEGAPQNAPAPARAVETPTAGPAARASSLSPLRTTDFATVIQPGLGCSFSVGGGNGLLLVAAAGSPTAVIRLNGVVLRLDAARPGHDYIEGGPLLRGGGVEVRVIRTRASGRQVGMEAMGWPAEIVVSRQGRDIARRQGEWDCGA